MYPLINPIQSFSEGLNVIPNYLNTLNKLQEAKRNNILNQMMMQYQEPQAQAQLAIEQAKAKYAEPIALAELQKSQMMAQNPLLNLTGPAGQIGAAVYLKQHGLDNILNDNKNGALPTLPGGMNDSNFVGNDLSKLIINNSQAKMLKDIAQTKLANKQAQGYDFRLMPQPQKNLLQGYAMALGYMPDEAMKKFTEQGMTINDLARERGVNPADLKQLTPMYAANSTDINRIHLSQRGLAEMDSLTNFVTDAMAPYSQKIFGYSPKQMIEAFRTATPGQEPVKIDMQKMQSVLKDESSENQAKFLASLTVLPELAAIRMRTLGGNVGVEAIRDILDASNLRAKFFSSLVKPEVFARAQALAAQQITAAANNANNAILNPFSKNNNQAKIPTVSNISSNSMQKMIRVKLPDGSTGSMPEDQYDAALKAKAIVGKL